MPPEWLELLRYLGVAALTYVTPRLVEYGTARLAARGQAAAQQDATDLTREGVLGERVTKLEGQVEGLNIQLLESERVRAAQQAQLADLREECAAWRAQFHDLAVSVQAETEPISARIWMRYQAAQIIRSAPTGAKE